MSQRPGARRVLLVSGGVAGVSKEILKYNVAGVDCVELDRSSSKPATASCRITSPIHAFM